MPGPIRLVTIIMATIAGIFLLISGIHGPTETYKFIMDLLPQFIQNQQILQIANIIGTVLIAISLAGGFAVIAGGILILINHVGTGKLLIGLGAGSGIPWLILLIITLLTTQQVAAVFTEYSTIGGVGIILAFVARIIAR
jgi:hypothetical protein